MNELFCDIPFPKTFALKIVPLDNYEIRKNEHGEYPGTILAYYSSKRVLYKFTTHHTGKP